MKSSLGNVRGKEEDTNRQGSVGDPVLKRGRAGPGTQVRQVRLKE